MELFQGKDLRRIGKSFPVLKSLQIEPYTWSLMRWALGPVLAR